MVAQNAKKSLPRRMNERRADPAAMIRDVGVHHQLQDHERAGNDGQRGEVAPRHQGGEGDEQAREARTQPRCTSVRRRSAT